MKMPPGFEKQGKVLRLKEGVIRTQTVADFMAKEVDGKPPVVLQATVR
jgi:hypothetical protein